MTARECAATYLRERMEFAFNELAMDQAHNFNLILTCVENMTDDEYGMTGGSEWESSGTLSPG